MKDETIYEDKIISKMAEVSREIGKEQITYLVKVCADEGMLCVLDSSFTEKK